ncbi:MAG: hypothetical protein GYA41_14095 [Bacteroidales bacterium]|nr:hypothetical protein [Bacteroidales bacterium]
MKKILKFLTVVFLVSGILTLDGCKKKPDPPTLTTTAVTEITTSTATTGGNVTSDGGAAVTAKGVCWGTTSKPVITGSKTTDGAGTGAFTSSLTGLTPNTLYYVRAYATNSEGTAYGNEVSFSTNQIVVATLTTTAVSAIASTTAVSGGNITDNGGGDITARGVCWSTSANPTTADSKTTDATGSGTFTSNMTGLLPGTTYHVRAYATNVAGTAYGNDLTFTTLAVVPTLTTTAASAITTTTATSGGNISADGGAPVTARGVCWSTATGPVVTGSHTTDGTGTGSFPSSITGLAANTTYYVRAYATNSIGTAYGNEITFKTSQVVVPTLTTTAVSAISGTTATSGGSITGDGGGSITAKGVCWSNNANPTIADSHTSNGTGSGAFTSNLTNLLPGTTYHVRAYATNSAGTAYGNDISFTTLAVLPVVTTTAASAITQTSATSGGNVTSTGGATVTARGVCWSTSVSPTIADSRTTDGTGAGTFTSSITGLTPGTRYYVRAYATNSVGTAYGNEISFTSGAVSAPVLTTTAASAIGITSATSGGNITSNGGGAITEKGVCWGTSPNPTTSGSHTSDGTGTGSFSSSLTGLSTGTLYYIRAYATNSAGTSYGNQLTFFTLLEDADGNTYHVINIGTQIWMVENLKTTKYNDDTDIPNITDATAWSDATGDAYCWYDNNSGYKNTYGALYNWFAVNTGKLCPTGWHVPQDDEYGVLEVFLGLPAADVGNYGWRGTTEGTEMKSTSGWSTGNGTNTSGFTALPAGYRYFVDGLSYGQGAYGYFWTSSETDETRSWYRMLWSDNGGVNRGAVEKQAGKSVRCVKD